MPSAQFLSNTPNPFAAQIFAFLSESENLDVLTSIFYFV